MLKLKQIIPVDRDNGMFGNMPFTVKADGSLCREINSEIMPPMIPLNKTKMSSLMPVLNWISKDWGLNLSKTHDRTVAFRILKNSVIKN